MAPSEGPPQPPASYFQTSSREAPSAPLQPGHPSSQWTIVPPQWQASAGAWLGTRNWLRLVLLVILLAGVIAASQLLARPARGYVEA